MKIDWDKKKYLLKWGAFCGVLLMLFMAFINGKVFNGENALSTDLMLSAMFVVSPIFTVFIFYWPLTDRKKKREALP